MVNGGGRFRRWVLALGAVLLAMAAAATWAPGLLNLERYRGQIAQQVGRAIGREVSVGAITASVWRLGAEARGIRVADKAEFGPAPFLEAEALRVRLELLPLLRGQVRVATAVLERPRIHVVRDLEGRWNIKDLWPAAAGVAAATAGRPGIEPPRGLRQHLPPGPLVRELRARGAEVRFDDRRATREGTTASLAIRNARLDLRQGDTLETVIVRIAGEALGGTLEAAATLGLRGNVPTVDGRASVTGFDLGALEAYLGKGAASGPADLAITAKGPLPGFGAGPGPGLDLTGELDLARARLEWGALARKAPGEEAHLTLAGRLVGEGVDLPKVRVRWRGTGAEGRLSVVRLRPLEATFAAEAARLDLDQLLAPPGAMPQAGEKAARWLELLRTPRAWASPPPTPTGRGGGGETPMRGDPRARAEGAIRAGAVRWHGLEARDVRATLAYRDAVLGIRNATGVLSGGRLDASGTVDLRGRYPGWTASVRLEGAEIQPLVAAVARGEKPVEAHGILTGEGKITSPALAAPNNALGALVGSGSFVVRDGRVAGYKPLERLGDMLASATGGVTPLKARLDEFQRLSANFTLDKGFLRTQDLTLVRPDAQAKMAGSMNLLDTSLDFNAKVQLGKVTLEAKVMGTTADPLVVPTVARLDKRFEMELDRALKGDRGKKMRDLLRNLLQ